MATSAEILRTFRFTPRLAPDLLREVVRAPLPHFDGVRLESLDGTSSAAGVVTEPLVIVLTDKRTPVQAIVVASPESCENAQRVEWPRWARETTKRIGGGSSVLIVTSDLVIERWAKQPIHLQGEVFAPVVLGPSALAPDLPQTTPVLLLMTLSSLVRRDA